MTLAPWQQRAYDKAAEALDAGRLPHGLLFAGPAELGKRLVAEKLAKRVLCLQRASGEDACGQCRSCQLFESRSQTDPAETRPDGRLAHPFGHPAHPDARWIGYGWNEKTKKMRGEIVIEQIRLMSEKLALTPQYGVHQVAILDPADAINHAASNALLKTLEEPQPGRFLWLISARPARLSATIRSRTQMLEFRLPNHDEALAWLVGEGHSEARADEALRLAGGHPGMADHWLHAGALDLRKDVAKDLDGVKRDGGQAAAVAVRWVGDEQAALRLSFAADIALEQARRAEPRHLKKLVSWFDQANRSRELLRTTVRADLVVLDLLLAWHATQGA